jgi:hypothetical protein
VEERSEDLEDLPLSLDRDPDGPEGLLRDPEFLCIVDTGDGEGSRTTLVEVVELVAVFESERLAFGRSCTGEELVEDVVVAFGLGLVDESGAFKEVGTDASSNDRLGVVEENLVHEGQSGSRIDLERWYSPRCTFRNETSCRCESFWRYRMLP